MLHGCNKNHVISAARSPPSSKEKVVSLLQTDKAS